MANVYSCITANSDWWDGTESWGGETNETNRDTKFSTRNYSSLSAWETARDGASSGGDTEYAVLVGPFSSTITSGLTIAGWNADDVVIEAPITLTDGQDNAARHPGYVDGTPDHYRVRNTTGHSFTLQESATIDGLDIENQSTGTSDECIRISADGVTVTVKNVIGGFNTQNSEQDFIYTNGNSAENLGTITIENCHVWNCERAVLDIYDGNGAETYTVDINSCHFYNIGDGHRAPSGRGGLIGQGGSTGAVNFDVRNCIVHYDSQTGDPFSTVSVTGTRRVDQCITSESNWDNAAAGGGDPTVTNSATGHTWATTDQGAGDYVIHQGVKDLRLVDLTNAKNEAQDRHSTATAIGLTIPSTDIVGTSRPQNTDYDLGAFEIAAAGTVDELLADDVESKSEVDSPSVGQKHVITADDVESSSQVDSATIGQAHTLLADNVESDSQVSAPDLIESNVLLADDVESSSEVSSPLIGQAQTLLANDVESSSEVSIPSVGQVHGILADDVESVSEVSKPTLLEGSHSLLADDVESVSEVSAPAIAQAQALLAEDVESTSEVSSTALSSSEAANSWFNGNQWLAPFFGSSWWGESAGADHSILADDVESSSSVDSPSIGQAHALTADDVESASEVSSPAIAQAQALLADDVESDSHVSIPAVAESHAILADNVESSSGVSSPTIDQVQALLAGDVESASELSVPAIAQAQVILADNVESASEASTATLLEFTPSSGEVLSANNFFNINLVLRENAAKTYTIQWSSTFNAGVTVIASEWQSFDPNMIIANEAFDTESVSARLSARYPGEYRVANRITDSDGAIDERYLTMEFKENFELYDYG